MPNNKNRTRNERTACSTDNKKSKNSAWKIKDGEQWKGRRKYKTEHQVKEVHLKLLQYCIQITIVKTENFSSKQQ